jgi:sterol desaturase/sphingolipid hydroxylase (fatty acid hydroxylase superfamily)
MDLTVAAVPGYFATMGLEYRYLRNRAVREGPSAADYERRDTVTSLTMGTLSLVAPMVAAKVIGPFVPGKGRYGKALVGTAIGAAAVTTVADVVARRQEREPVDESAPRRERRRRIRRMARRIAMVAGPAAIATGGVAITSALWSRVDDQRIWERRVVRDLGSGPAALGLAVIGWDFIYYWNHRFMHTSRYMWAVHVVHHSSERYNLSTALRQPVADALGTFIPSGLLCAFGIRPDLVQTARGINLIYQYWFHTDTIRSLGPFERVLNTASHHRVHHGSNRQYLDRNHGSILITWDKMFGTFEPEREPVVYGLTKNINTFNPARVAFHEHRDMLRDVSRSTNWRDRLNFVLRGPGWAYARHAAEAPAVAGQRSS